MARVGKLSVFLPHSDEETWRDSRAPRPSPGDTRQLGTASPRAGAGRGSSSSSSGLLLAWGLSWAGERGRAALAVPCGEGVWGMAPGGAGSTGAWRFRLQRSHSEVIPI